jgi:hypothetical protein
MSATPYLYASPDFAHFAAIATDVNIMASDPKKQNRLCRRISCNGPAIGTAANIVLTRGDGTNVTMTIVGGQTLEVQAKAIVAAGTTATNVGVYW